MIYFRMEYQVLNGIGTKMTLVNNYALREDAEKGAAEKDGTISEREEKPYIQQGKSNAYTSWYGFHTLGDMCSCRGEYLGTAVSLPDSASIEAGKKAFMSTKEKQRKSEDQYYSQKWV